MSGRELKSARAIAVQVLEQFDPAREYAAPRLDRLRDRTDERQRATDLVYGTIRNLHAIDAVIAKISGRKIERIAPPLLSVLRVGVYELVYHPATPAYSIVSEAVNNARRVGGSKQTGFVNAVLRGIERRIVNRQSRRAASNPQRILIQDAETGCEFDTDLLPDPADSPAAYLSTSFSLPPWLVSTWLDAFGPEQTRRVCLASNRRPSLYLRANPLRITAQDLLAQFERESVRAQMVPPETLGPDAACGMLKVVGPHAITELPGFSDGLFTVQDLSASQAVRILQPQPGWRILDLCSAPGTKTTQLAEITRDAAHIVATDIDPERMERVRENISRLGLNSITIIPHAQLEQGMTGQFDAILLDVPCSNTGVLARRVEARFRVKPGTVEKLAAGQRDLLHEAAALIKPGGRICYSTCSIQQTENERLIRDFLTRTDVFELARAQIVLPSAQEFDHDGAYIALLIRRR